jgi:signal peptidase I
MLPLLMPGDRVLVDRGAFRHELPERGALVVFHDPERPGHRLLKRVSGLPDDVLLRGDQGFAVGPASSVGEGIALRRLHPHELFVTGDNASVSRDSRRFGPIDRRRLIGRVWFRYAPAERAGPIPAAP